MNLSQKFEIAKSWRGSSPSPLCSQLVRTKRAGAAHCSTVPHSLSTQLHSSQSEIQFSRQPRPSSPFPITNTLMLQPSVKYKKDSMGRCVCTFYNIDAKGRFAMPPCKDQLFTLFTRNSIHKYNHMSLMQEILLVATNLTSAITISFKTLIVITILRCMQIFHFF